jgi:hypothetical protein
LEPPLQERDEDPKGSTYTAERQCWPYSALMVLCAGHDRRANSACVLFAQKEYEMGFRRLWKRSHMTITIHEGQNLYS